ncbi:MAG: histidine kinase dimerization/phospho-acceptor domain-containing protein [Caldilineales bacterium]
MLSGSLASDWFDEAGGAVEPVVVATLLARRRVAWVTADESLRVISVVDATGLLGPTSDWPGGALLEALPELVGSEADLDAVFAGRCDGLQVDLLERANSAGQPVYVRLSVAAGKSGADRALFCIFEDVTDLGISQQRLTQSRNELLLAQRSLADTVLDLQASNTELRRLTDMKSVFVSVAAHELRTPLAVISSYADLLAQGLVGDLNERQLQSLAVIRDGADRLMHITANLLDMTRIEAGRLEMVLQVLDLGVGGVGSRGTATAF